MKGSSLLRILLLIAGHLGIYCDETETENLNSTSSDVSVKLLCGETHGISLTDLTLPDSEPQEPVMNGMDVRSVDYHYKKEMLFYTSNGGIWRFPLFYAGGYTNGEQIELEDAGAASLAVDWVHDFIYWTCPVNGTVLRSDLEEGKGISRQVIIADTGNITIPNNIVVDPYIKYLFVATESGYCLRSDLEGGNLVRLEHGFRRTILALDFHNRRLYIYGLRDSYPILQSSDYFRGDVIEYTMHFGGGLWKHLMSIDVFSASTVGQEPQLFWANRLSRENDVVYKVNISHREPSWLWAYQPPDDLPSWAGHTKIWCVKVYHPNVQTRPKYLESSASSLLPKQWLPFMTAAYLILRRVLVTRNFEGQNLLHF